MARHGENIRKRKDGRWEGRYPLYDKEKGKTFYRSVYAPTYEEVKEKLAGQKNVPQKANTTLEHDIDLHHIQFSDMAQAWLTEVKEKRKLSTYVKYNLVYHNYMEEIFEKALLSDISDIFVKENLPELLSDSVKKSIYCVINQILKFSSEKYAISTRTLRIPVLPVRNKGVRVLTRREQKELISTLYQEMDIYKMAILLCLLTGLRLGELCALKWSDIDLEHKIFTVNRTVQRLYMEERGTVLLETAPKSESSRREIPLSDQAFMLLNRFWNGKEYVFGGDKPLEPRTLQYHFKKICKNTCVSDKNFHILRHTFSTNCIEGGMDIKSLSEMLGHSDVQITLNRYVHPSMDSKRQYMNALSKYYDRISGPTV